jgi:D-serine deaminase-like pyridoxal phosphate-dependent protein
MHVRIDELRDGARALAGQLGVLEQVAHADMVPHPHAHVTGLSEEHGWVQVRGGAALAVGDSVRVVPNHACVVVNTQDRLFLVDDDEVIREWTVDARGQVR